ncbi:MAG: HlyD family efflux transporter periplasmic adaptor subunit [Gammaproteobacteria bacterium]|nr:HlyD family efflux transporter periplasmic adaptor subunit [Gammaproteobacteria bacterium]
MADIPSGMDRPIERRRTRPLLVAGLSVVVLAGVVWFLYSAGASGTSFTLDGQRIQIGDVRRGVYEDFIPLRASVEPEKTVYLDAVEGGRVERVIVEEGAIVEAGQPLLELSNTSLQLDVIGREAEVSEQLNNLRNTQLAIEQNRLKLRSDLIEIDYQVTKLTRLIDRYQHLEADRYVSRQDYENAQDELAYWKARRQVTEESQRQDERIRVVQMEQLENSVDQLQRNLGIARSNLEDLLLKAPRAGQLTALDAEVGESKFPGQRLGQIDDVDRFKASALVNEFYLNRVRVGQRAALTLTGKDYQLEVTKVYSEVKAAQFEIDLRFVDAAPTAIRRGQTLQLRLVLGDLLEQAVLLPNGPFYNDTGGAWVFVLDANGSVAQRREVSLGRRNPGEIEVLSGLVPGDRVITSSYNNFINVDRLFIDG